MIYFSIFITIVAVTTFSIVLVQSQYNNKPILTYYKSGGLIGIMFRLEIYKNNTYKFFSHKELAKEGTLSLTEFNKITEFIKIFPELKNHPFDHGGCDMFSREIEVSNKLISVDSELPDNVKEIVSLLEKYLPL